MSDRTSIEWTDATWNTVGGCTRVHEGCTNCYAEIMAARFSKPGQWGEGLAQIVTRPDGSKDHRWTGKVRFNAQALTQPMRWKKPRRIFVNSTADTFHDGVTDDQLDQMFAVMALCPQHTFQVLTKRPERAARYLSSRDTSAPGCKITDRAFAMNHFVRGYRGSGGSATWPLPNVWIGTSISDQASADAMIPHLLNTPAAVRFLSVEPMLGPVDLEIAWHGESALEAECWGDCAWCINGHPPLHNCQRGQQSGAAIEKGRDGIDWVICGGESGPGARPMHPDWARSLRDQCQAAGVPFFFKQWGEWGYGEYKPSGTPGRYAIASAGPHSDFWPQSVFPVDSFPRQINLFGGASVMERVGKRAAGRLLDGREWNEMPGAAA